MIARVPKMSARGRLRAGSLISPLLNERPAHPPQAHITDTNAVASADRERAPVHAGVKFRTDPVGAVNANTTSRTRAEYFTRVARVVTAAAFRTPTTFNTPTTAISSAAPQRPWVGVSGRKELGYAAKIGEIAPSAEARIPASWDQPNRKAGIGPKPSSR